MKRSKKIRIVIEDSGNRGLHIKSNVPAVALIAPVSTLLVDLLCKVIKEGAMDLTHAKNYFDSVYLMIEKRIQEGE